MSTIIRCLDLHLLYIRWWVAKKNYLLLFICLLSFIWEGHWERLVITYEQQIKVNAFLSLCVCVSFRHSVFIFILNLSFMYSVNITFSLSLSFFFFLLGLVLVVFFFLFHFLLLFIGKLILISIIYDSIRSNEWTESGQR